jgi:hypothetical protein
MTGNDVLDDGEELNADLALLENLQLARKSFLNAICDASASQEPNVLLTLRLESTYQLAEFLYLLRAQGIYRANRIETLVDLHNQYIVDVTKDPAKLSRLGLSRDRLLDAMFTADTLPRLLHHWSERPGTLDQSNLARFLVTLMSTETCRKIVVACAAAGFLERERSPYGAMLVRSVGTLERLFAGALRELRCSIREGA